MGDNITGTDEGVVKCLGWLMIWEYEDEGSIVSLVDWREFGGLGDTKQTTVKRLSGIYIKEECKRW